MFNLPKLLITFLTLCIPLQIITASSPIVNPSPLLTSTRVQRLTLGYKLQANSNITITSLGTFHSALIPMVLNKPVGVWDSLGNLLGSTTALTTDTLIGSYRYRTLTSPISINAGAIFYLGGLNVSLTTANAFVPTVSAVNAGTTTFNGVTLLEYRRSPSPPSSSQGVLTFPSLDPIASPTLNDINPVLANAIFEIVPTPEPSTYILMASMLLGAGLLINFKRKIKATTS